MVKDITDLPRAIRQAFLIATSGRPGPVLVDLPKDVTSATLTRPVNSAPAVPSFYKFQINQEGRRKELEEAALRAAALINQSKRPVLYVGAGALNHSELVRELARVGNIPVTTTLQGMGVFDELDPLSLHMLGMHGSAYANHAMQKADVIIAVGARFDDRVTGNLKLFAPAAKQAAAEGRGGIIHLEISSKNINKSPHTHTHTHTRSTKQSRHPSIGQHFASPAELRLIAAVLCDTCALCRVSQVSPFGCPRAVCHTWRVTRRKGQSQSAGAWVAANAAC